MIRIILVFYFIHLSVAVLGKDYSIEYFTSEQGLSQNEVTCILQDTKGFMWFGTNSGLNRYDGYEFVIYKSRANKATYLSNSAIESIFQDKNGDIWVGTVSGGLNVFDYTKEQFYQIHQFGKAKQTINDNRIISINQSSDGRMFIGTWTEGLYILDYENDTLLNPIPDTRIYDILIEDERTAWLGTNYGLIKFNPQTNEKELIRFGDNQEITDIKLKNDTEHMWLVGWKAGLIKMNKKTLEWKRYSTTNINDSDEIMYNDFYSLLIDTKNKLWLGSWGNGTFIFDPVNETFEVVDLKPKNKQQFKGYYSVVLDIFEDNNQNIWFGTSNDGIVSLRGNVSFKGISIDENPDCGLRDFKIRKILQTSDSAWWIGTELEGLYFSKDLKYFTQVPPTVDSRENYYIQNLFQFDDSTLWVSTADLLFELNFTKSAFKLKPTKHPSINKIKKITSYINLGDGLLIGTQQNGLFYIDNNLSGNQQEKNYIPQNDSVLKSNRITFIKKDFEGQVWIGTYDGLYLFDFKNRTVVKPPFNESTSMSSNIRGNKIIKSNSLKGFIFT